MNYLPNTINILGLLEVSQAVVSVAHVTTSLVCCV
jgi:hypothetical protein